MLIEDFLEQEALSFDQYEDAAAVQKILIENGYCTMLSREEELWMLNWVWTSAPADRNQVIFISREVYEDEEDRFFKQHPEYWEGEDNVLCRSNRL